MLLCALVLLPVVATAAPPFVWIEGEAPASVTPAALKPNVAGWGHPEFLSGQKWLQVSVEADKVEAQVPEEGVILTYPFTAAAAGGYQVWDRIGYEFVRSPFDWSIDGKPWTRILPDELTTDLYELQDWNEVAWMQLGWQKLTAGPHTLRIRLPRTKDEKGRAARILYASDALCLTAGPFVPNGRYKPGESGRSVRDLQAERNVFALPAPGSAAQRATIALGGLWQLARDDEQTPREVAAPIRALPSHPVWRSIQVPGDKMQQPDLVMAHRLWYRTRVRVPTGYAGRSFFLTFPQNNLNTTVYVNGVLCGFNKNPFAHFDIDVTKAVKPGVNVVTVGIRDSYYGYSASPTDPLKLRRRWNLPLAWTHQGFQDLAYPIWGHFESGILQTPTLTAAGPVRAADIFCKPSVNRKELALEVTLANPGVKPVAGEVVCQAVDPKTAVPAKTLAPRQFRIAPGGRQTLNLAEAWANPRLWWPDDPQMYLLRATVRVAGKAVDVSDTPFGFREWTADGPQIKLNGIVWHGWAELSEDRTKEEWLAWYRRTNQRIHRFWGANWYGLSPDDAFDFYDRNGVVVRRSGMLDGEAIGYNAPEHDPELRKLYHSDIKMDLMRNWRDQLTAQVRGERNHPSIMIWSIENEWLYINCINLHGDLMDQFEAEVKHVSDAVRAVDPTRLTMTDGGGANKDQSMPVHGNHYVFADERTGGMPAYPALAYEANPKGGGRDRWVWDQQRPRFIGEDYFATGINPFDYAYFGGEETFQGKAQARPAAGLVTRMLTEGYRWAGYSAYHFWLGESAAKDYWLSNAPRAVFCRQWDWTFGSGQKVKRTFGVFNDTHVQEPLTFTWTLVVAGQKRAEANGTFAVTPGGKTVVEQVVPMPEVNARTEGELLLTLSAAGKEVYRDVKPVSILPPVPLPQAGGGGGAESGEQVKPPNPNRGSLVGAIGAKPAPAGDADNTAKGRRRGDGGRSGGGERSGRRDDPSPNLQPPTPASRALLVYDPHGSTAAFLAQAGYEVTPVQSLHGLPESPKVLLVGKDALDAQESGSSELAAWASGGRAVIVLEQQNPLKYQAIPAEMDPANNEGGTAFPENLSHPVFRALQAKDFYTWAGGDDEIVYRNAYLKPTRGATSLVQCHNRLANCALAEAPAGSGVLLLCQLVVGEKLNQNAVARQLLVNLVDYAEGYRQEFRRVSVALGDNANLTGALNAGGVKYSPAAGPLEAMESAPGGIAVVSATSANLKALADNRAQVQSFTDAGGWLVLNGLTPEGLADYSRLVGVDHMIRPFGRERVMFPARRNPLTAGLTTGDIVMLSGERIFDWTSDEFVANDEFSYVVDLDDVAPFMKFPNDFAALMVNGFRNADAWKYIVNLPQKDADWTLTLPKVQILCEVTWAPNQNYHYATKFSMTFDGKETRTFDLKVNNEPQTFAIDPPLPAREVRLRITAVERNPSHEGEITGLDNIWINAVRDADWRSKVRPMLNIGAMVEYPRGKGGIILCNVLFKEREAVPENARKKQRILAAVLRNLKAPFSGGAPVIAGASLEYQPLEISKQANQYRDDKGWFGDKQYTFADLPKGSQVFAGVPFQVFEFATSPVPTAIMLGGSGVPNNLPEKVAGIPVGAKADALFFLQAARIDQPMNDQERRERKRLQMAQYVVHYVDGQTATVPVCSEIDVADYHPQSPPQAVPGAQVAWARQYPGSDRWAAAYVQQWTNPRPDVSIDTVDLQYGPDRRGIPALLALTAARTR